MKKLDIDFNVPMVYKIQILQDYLNELLEELNKKEIITLEVETNEQTNSEKYE